MPTFNGDILPEVLVMSEEVFAKDRSKNFTMIQPIAAQHLLDRQTARAVPLIVENKCREHRVAFSTMDTTAPPVLQGAADASTCTLNQGDSISTLSKNYANNLFLPDETMTIPDYDCPNQMEFMQRVAVALNHKRHLISQSLNIALIQSLKTNAMNPFYASDNGTINGTTIEYNTALLTNPDTLAEWKEIGMVHNLGMDPVLIHSRNFHNQNYNAQFKALNDNERSLAAQIAATNGVWDLKQMISLGLGRDSFLIDRNAYVFANRSVFSTAPQQMDDPNNTLRFAIPLTYVSYDANGNIVERNFTYQNGGETRTIMLDVEYQKTCNTSLSDSGRMSYDHTWRFHLDCLFDFAPTSDIDGQDQGTGVLNFVGV